MEDLKDVIARIESIENPKELLEATYQLFKSGDDARDAGLPMEIPEVERLNDIPYGDVPKWQELDIYLPKNRSGKVPTIVHIHGGGHVYGTKETYQFFGMEMAKTGFGFVNFNYRLPPEVVYPAELDDVNRVLHWVAKNGVQYDLDRENIIIMGDSAGGQMTLQYITTLCNSDFRQRFGYEKPALTIRAAVINCAGGFLKKTNLLDGRATRQYFTDDILAEYSDLLDTENYITEDLVPLFITTANADMLLEASARLDGFLLAKEIEHEYKCYGDMENPRYHVFNYNIRDEIGKQCNQDIATFCRKYLKYLK